MVKHTHKAGESLIGMPWHILVVKSGVYFIGEYNGVDYDCSGGVNVGLYVSFDWYDLTELGE